jgi:hypothetical protein
MAFGKPISIDPRGNARRADQGGGGGSDSNEWKDWTDLPLDPSDGWTVVDGAGGGSASLGLDGSILKFEQGSSTNMRIQGSEMKGKAMIRSIHLKPWEDAGIATPSGTAANLFQPESMIFKLEVQFDTDGGGPINGDSGNGYGNHLACLAGLTGYSSDQSGSPTIGGTGVLWLGAMVHKNAGNEPSGSTSTSLYKGGYRTYFTNSGTVTGYTWKNMSSPPAGAHDALVFCTPPLRKEASANGRNDIFAGSYASGAAFYPMAVSGQTIYDNATKLSDTSIQNFWHICLWFGTNSTSGGSGVIRIKKIRYILQPLQNREPLS